MNIIYNENWKQSQQSKDLLPISTDDKLLDQ